MSDPSSKPPSAAILQAEAAGIMGPSLRHDAPLQLKRGRKEIPQGMPITHRLRAFLRRNAGITAVGVFLYVEFVGFPSVTVTPQDHAKVITLRRWWDNKIVAACEYTPPVETNKIVPAGAFSIVDKALPGAAQYAQSDVIRPSLSTRLYNYAASYFPNPCWSRLNDSPDGRNTLQYNRLLYYPQNYTKRKTSFLGIDAITKDQKIAVHVAVKMMYRPAVVIVSNENPGAPFIGMSEAVLDIVAKSELGQWIRDATAEDVAYCPQRRLHSETGSIAGLTPKEVRQSVEQSTVAHLALQRHAANPDSEPVPEELARRALSPEETLRRIWTSHIAERMKGRAVIDDIVWKMTLVQLEHDPNLRIKDPTLSSSWQF